VGDVSKEDTLAAASRSLLRCLRALALSDLVKAGGGRGISCGVEGGAVDEGVTGWCTVDVVRDRFLLAMLAVGIWRPRRPAVMASVSERSSPSASLVWRASSYSCTALNAAELLNGV
jgi:hypothetical protein